VTRQDRCHIPELAVVERKVATVSTGYPMMQQGNDAALDARLDDAWRTYHARLVVQATRTLRDPAAAEDVVQEAFRALGKVPVDEIDDVGGWLSVVVRRLCVNRLRSAYARHEGLADGIVASVIGDADPADRVTLDDEVQLALAVMLDRLTPAERTSFVLHDVFGFPFDAIAAIVGRTPTACRQLASRARRRVRTNAPTAVSADVERMQHRAVVERFIAACAGGDIAELMAVLDPDVDGHAELIGFGTVADLSGRPAVVQRLIGIFGPGSGTLLVPVPVEGDAAVVVYLQGRVAAVVRFDHEGGRIRHIRSFVIPPTARR
jgi:RNA polymerase sigma-70 factor, ECF subfamily